MRKAASVVISAPNRSCMEGLASPRCTAWGLQGPEQCIIRPSSRLEHDLCSGSSDGGALKIDANNVAAANFRAEKCSASESG